MDQPTVAPAGAVEVRRTNFAEVGLKVTIVRVPSVRLCAATVVQVVPSDETCTPY